MWNRHNVHKMFINIYRNPKTRNWFRYETFIHLFEFKGFSTWGERDTISLCWLLLHRQLSTQPTRGTRSAQIRLASPSSESRLSRSEAGTQLTAFSQILKILSPRFRCMTSLISPGLNSSLGFLFWYLWMTHPLRARANTCAHICTLLTHALNRKVLILPKLKGKIYKTKSLRNYITKENRNIYIVIWDVIHSIQGTPNRLSS